MEIGIGLVIGLVVGLVAGYFIIQATMKSKKDTLLAEVKVKTDEEIRKAQDTAKRILDEAESKNETIKQRKVQEAKDRFNAMRSEFDKEKAEKMVAVKERELEIRGLEKDLQSKEDKLQNRAKELDARDADFEQKVAENNAVRENLEKQLKVVAKRKEELEAANEERIKALEGISRLTQSEAKEQLLEAIKGKAETDAMALVKETITQAKLDASKESKKIIIQTIQRMASEYTIENTVSVFPLDSDDMKGQIIGREGRNIRALEAATGAEIVVDDTPEADSPGNRPPILEKTRDRRPHTPCPHRGGGGQDPQAARRANRRNWRAHGYRAGYPRPECLPDKNGGAHAFPLLLWPEPAQALHRNCQPLWHHGR
jgi:ribonucrease Y